MRRLLLLAAVPVALLGVGTAAAWAGMTAPSTATAPPTTTPTTTTPTPPSPRATLDACATGAAAVDRHALFTATMPGVKGAVRMAMRFALFTRPGTSGPWRLLHLPKWGLWQRSKTGVPAFIYSKRVDGLVATASYRATVTMRWFDARRAVVRTATRTTPACVQRTAPVSVGGAAPKP